MSGPGPWCSAERPFPGLRPFQKQDADWFFGRDAQGLALYRLVRESRFVAVVGASGSGKSSLVKAGLLPRLERASAFFGSPWHLFETRPGNAPIRRLAEVLAGLDPEARGIPPEPADEAEDRRIARFADRQERAGLARWGIEPLLNGRSDGLARALDLAPDAAAAERVLLVVDQFEELFRFGEEAGGEERAARREEARAFVELLLRGAGDPSGRLTVLVTMRSDFFGDCGRFHALAEAVSASQYLVPQLDRESLVPIIRRPVEEAGAGIDPLLVQKLLLDREENDRLPVLQHALMRLWSIAGERPGVRHLALEDYRRIGGLEEALSRHAEEVRGEIDGWPADGPPGGPAGGPAGALVERLFKELTDTDRQNRAIRRRRTVAELEAVAAAGPDGRIDPARAAALRRVIDRFREPDCSFLVPSPVEVPVLTAEHQIDIGHEALIRRWRAIAGEKPNANDGEAEQWRRLGWLEQERRDGDSWRLLLSAAQEWDRTPAAGKPGKLLPETAERKRWRARVNATAAWADRHGGGLALVDGFLAACEKARLRRRTWSRLMAGAAVAAGLATVVAGVLAFERVSEERNHAMELALRYSDRLADDALRELGNGRTRAAANLIAEAFPDWVDDPRPWRDTLPHRALEQILASRPAARGEWLVETGDNNVVFALSPDGRHVAAGSLDSEKVSVWDTASRSLVWETPRPPEGPFQLHTFPSLAFSPDGSRLATHWSGGKVKVFETATGDPIAEFEGHGEDVNAVAMNPAGDRVASAGDDRTLRLRRIGAADAEAVLRHNARVTAVAWSPDGSRLATGTAYGLVTLFDVAGPEPRMLEKTATAGHYVTAVRFSPDGGTLAIGDAAGQVRMVTVGPAGPLATPVIIEAHTRAIRDLLFTNDGKLLTGGWADGVAAWDAASGQAAGILGDVQGIDVMAQPAGTGDLALVMDSGAMAVRKLDTLAPPKNRFWIPEPSAVAIAAGKSGPVSLWWDDHSGLEHRVDSATGTTLTKLPTGGRMPARTALSASGGVTALQFAETVEVGTPGAEPWVIDVADWAPDGILVSDDGRRVVGWDPERIRVWEAGSGEASDVALSVTGIAAVAMDAPGSNLAFGTEEGRAGLVDLDARRELWSFGLFEAEVSAIALSPADGLIAASAYGDAPDRNATAILDPRPGRPPVTMVGGFGGMNTLAFVNGGETLVGSDGDNVLAARTYDGVMVARGGGYDIPDIAKLVNGVGEGPVPALGHDGEILALDRKTLEVSVSVPGEGSDLRDAWASGDLSTVSAITAAGHAHHWRSGSPWPAVSRNFAPGSTLIPLPSGSLLVILPQGVGIWDPGRDSVEPVPQTGPGMPRAVAVAPDARSIVLVRSDGAVDHLSFPDGHLLRTLGYVNEGAATVLTDGTTAILHEADEIRSWRLADGGEIAFVRPEQGLSLKGVRIAFWGPRPAMLGSGGGRVVLADRTIGAVEVWVPASETTWRPEWWRAGRADDLIPLQSNTGHELFVTTSATRNRSRFGGSTRDNSVNLLRLWSPGLDRVLAHAAVDGQPISLRIDDGRWDILVQRAGALHVETVTPRGSDLATLLGELRALRAGGLAEFTPEERALYRVDPLTPQAQPDRQEQAAPPRPANRGGPAAQ
ncbi:hypothetical protein [Skermanella pratensis]|uniref:nSTAND1 domain-containing NTPase n=1 Tax=Skermanella pratensis TaxID=2233999 RepID=UPI0013010A67|nr:hypothetical protein [Skermanella pratensis]